MKNIRFSRSPTPLSDVAGAEWEVLGGERGLSVMKALSDPFRYLVYTEIDRPVRQGALLEKLKARTKKPLTHALLGHHLRILERSGLIGVNRSPRNTVVYRVMDVRLCGRPTGYRAEPGAPPRKVEFEDAVKQILGKKPDASGG
jgi:hypothetical protein